MTADSGSIDPHANEALWLHRPLTSSSFLVLQPFFHRIDNHFVFAQIGPAEFFAALDTAQEQIARRAEFLV